MEVDNRIYYNLKEIDEIPPKEELMFSPALQQSLTNLIKNEDYLTYKINKKLLGPNGENFLGVLYAVNVTGKTADGDKETNLFVKIITPGEKITFLTLSDIYIRELYIYRELSQIFEDIQNEHHVPKEQRYKMVKSYNESNPEAIILENMNNKGYKTYFRMDVISLKFAELATRELAKFHALSFALKEKMPMYFEKHIKNIKHPYHFNDDWSAFVTSLSATTLNYLDVEAKQKLEIFMTKFVDKNKLYLEDETTKLCLCHGDYRPNNIMMKECNGQISEVIPIDYQLIYYGCPVIDFIYFIFAATDQAFRRAYLPYLKDIYHCELKVFLEYFGIDVDSIFPRKQFEDVYKARLDYGLLISLVLVPILMASKDEVPDLVTESIANLNINTDDKCKERMVGIVEDFIEWGYL